MKFCILGISTKFYLWDIILNHTFNFNIECTRLAILGPATAYYLYVIISWCSFFTNECKLKLNTE